MCLARCLRARITDPKPPVHWEVGAHRLLVLVGQLNAVGQYGVSLLYPTCMQLVCRAICASAPGHLNDIMQRVSASLERRQQLAQQQLPAAASQGAGAGAGPPGLDGPTLTADSAAWSLMEAGDPEYVDALLGLVCGTGMGEAGPCTTLCLLPAPCCCSTPPGISTLTASGIPHLVPPGR